MTTFVLHGGRASVDSPENKIFNSHFTDLVEKNEVKIIICYWARNRNEWSHLFERDKSIILKQTNKRVEFSIAENIEDLYSKLSTYDVLYVSGGDAEPIEVLLPKLTDLKNHLENKVYLGSSMGAFVASKNYVLSMDNQDEDSVHQGLGLIPVNTLCHWNVETHKEKKMKLLADFDKDTKIITLDEGQTEIFQQ